MAVIGKDVLTKKEREERKAPDGFFNDEADKV
jgi:hypothetical protein